MSVYPGDQSSMGMCKYLADSRPESLLASSESGVPEFGANSLIYHKSYFSDGFASRSSTGTFKNGRIIYGIILKQMNLDWSFFCKHLVDGKRIVLMR